MALIKCSECGRDVSDKALACPHCNNPIHIDSVSTEEISPSSSLLTDLKESKEIFSSKRVIRAVLIGAGVLTLLTIIFLLSLQIPFANTFIQQILNVPSNVIQVIKNVPSFITEEIAPQTRNNKSGSSQRTIKENSSETNSLPPGSVIIPLQQITNVGYSFYLGKIDYPNSPDITDKIKNDITQVIYNSQLPKSLLKNIAIIIVNTLAVSPNQYIDTPTGKVKMIDLPPEFLKGGGIYSQNINQGSFIFINKNLVTESEDPYEKLFFGDVSALKLKNVLTHELGHYLSSQLTIADWEEYYQLRKIPANTPRYTQTWAMSPMEDFAEVYRNIFTGYGVRTYYGLLIPKVKVFVKEVACAKIHDAIFNTYLKKNNINEWEVMYGEKRKAIEEAIAPNQELQNCRKDVLLHPEKYPEDYKDKDMIGLPYYSFVDQQTKEFIINIINRVNG